jgi:hypothetical protein
MQLLHAQNAHVIQQGDHLSQLFIVQRHHV